MKSLRLWWMLALLLLALAPLDAVAQSVELSCPAGTTPLRGGSVTFDVTTGKLRQWECVDPFGNVTGSLTVAGGASFAPIQKASTQIGATADVQISNAITALPAGTGIVWADYSSNQTWAACPIWGTGNVQLVLFSVTYTIAVNCPIPATVSVQFAQGAILAPAAATTTTINGSAILGNRQKVVNIANGTVTFNGAKDIFVGWYGAPQDGVTDDAPAVNATLTANPGKNIYMLKTASAPCVSGSGGGCFGSFDGVFNSQVKIPENTSFGGTTAGGWPAGPVQVTCSTSLTVACVWMQAVSFNSRVRDIMLYGQKCWDSQNNNTYDVPAAMDGAGPDGILVTGGQAKIEDVSIYCFERHGIAVIGNNSLGDGGQPDFFQFKNITSYANRGWGLYAVGGDSNAGLATFFATYGNEMGGIFDNSQLGSTWTGVGSHIDNRNAIVQSGTQNISSITDTAGTVTVVLASGITTVGFTLGAWVTIAGTTNYNGTFKVTQFTDTAHFQFQLAGTFATETVGTGSYASSASVFAAIQALGGQFAKQGAFASNDASNESVWINPYCESTSQFPAWGLNALVLGGDAGHGCLANQIAGFNPGAMLSVTNGTFNFYGGQIGSGGGLNIRNFFGTSLNLDMRSDNAGDNVAVIHRIFDHLGNIKWKWGAVLGANGPFLIQCGNGNTGTPFEGDAAGAVWLTPCGVTFPVHIAWNGASQVDFFSNTNPTLTFVPGGTVSKYNSLNTTSQGVPSLLGSLNNTALTADQPPVTLYTTTASGAGSAGTYRVCFYAYTTTSGTGTTSTVTVGWNDGNAKTFTSATWALNSVTVTGQVNGCQVIHSAASQAIKVGTTAGTYGTSVYAIEGTVEQIR